MRRKNLKNKFKELRREGLSFPHPDILYQEPGVLFDQIPYSHCTSEKKVTTHYIRPMQQESFPKIIHFSVELSSALHYFANFESSFLTQDYPQD
jgi:hypothetical protein